MKAKHWFTIGISVIIIAAVAIFGPYSLIQEFNEKKAVEEFLDEDDSFKGQKVIDIDYRGSDTYFIQTEEKSYILMRNYTSMMNGHWKVFEETGIEGFY
ncbi:hypothetical protein [Halobacillus massiliensis]|uniref:hypothetical protein n=1 Tax=Halobacillus massiliensis TaxID=1926286 RepID=UPI0009E38764|nr:hypothetical protein [Halobacillus massiliensis]